MNKFRGTIILIGIFLVVVLVSQVDKEDVSPAELSPELADKVLVPETEAIKQESIPQQLDSLDLRLVGKGSDWGNEDDYLITISGRGFIITSKTPIVIFDNKLTFTGVEVNKDGTQLFTLIPQDRFTKQLIQGGFERLKIIGGSTEKDLEWLPLRLEDFERSKNLSRVVLKYRNNFFSREEERQ